MNLNSNGFIIDANSLITPFHNYYTFDWAPNFWQSVEESILSGNIVLLDIVRDEILRGNDELSKWMKRFDLSTIQSRQDRDIITKYGEILEYIQTCGLYKSTALSNWSDKKNADGWLIAAALGQGHTVVSFEASNKDLNSYNPSKDAKIPDVCASFSVTYTSLFEMMRSLDIKP